jgi:hypothetical protein
MMELNSITKSSDDWIEYRKHIMIRLDDLKALENTVNEMKVQMAILKVYATFFSAGVAFIFSVGVPFILRLFHGS